MASRAIFIDGLLCDFHFAIAKRKWSGRDSAREKLPPSLGAFDREHLPPFVITAGRTGGVRLHGAAALRAFVELRRLPAMRRLPRAQAHLRSFAFWDSHTSGLGKQEIGKRQLAPA
jgi:hypothetical protein